MNISTWILFAVVLEAAAAFGPVVFPTVTSENLEGRSITLPRDLARDHTLVIVAFQRKQQEMVDTWLPFIRSLAGGRASFDYYELPTIEKKGEVTRWFINRGMRGGIPDPAARERTVTLYLDKEPFKRALAIDNETTIHLLLLDRAGLVVWRTEGPYTAERGSELTAALSTAPSSPAPNRPQPASPGDRSSPPIAPPRDPGGR